MFVMRSTPVFMGRTPFVVPFRLRGEPLYRDHLYSPRPGGFSNSGGGAVGFGRGDGFWENGATALQTSYTDHVRNAPVRQRQQPHLGQNTIRGAIQIASNSGGGAVGFGIGDGFWENGATAVQTSYTDHVRNAQVRQQPHLGQNTIRGAIQIASNSGGGAVGFGRGDGFWENGATALQTSYTDHVRNAPVRQQPHLGQNTIRGAIQIASNSGGGAVGFGRGDGFWENGATAVQTSYTDHVRNAQVRQQPHLGQNTIRGAIKIASNSGGGAVGFGRGDGFWENGATALQTSYTDHVRNAPVRQQPHLGQNTIRGAIQIASNSGGGAVGFGRGDGFWENGATALQTSYTDHVRNAPMRQQPHLGQNTIRGAIQIASNSGGGAVGFGRGDGFWENGATAVQTSYTDHVRNAQVRQQSHLGQNTIRGAIQIARLTSLPRSFI
ncbi:hypothetical protein ACOME3_009960 [Neoechinorhynchus agilis]